jgi:hypothetical protein
MESENGITLKRWNVETLRPVSCSAFMNDDPPFVGKDIAEALTNSEQMFGLRG